MDVVMGFTKEHKKLSDDELTLQYLGIRLFNDAAASVRLALSGYYQVAFLLVRDILQGRFPARLFPNITGENPRVEGGGS